MRPISDPEPVTRVLVWDLPTRVFHWLLVASFTVALATGDSDRFRDVHVFSGYLLAGLVAFRMVWGFAGSRHARFKSFWFGPREAIGYVADVATGKARRHTGHNPAGSWAIYAMLLLAVVIIASGLVVLGAEEGHGALKEVAGFRLGEAVKELHESLSWIMLALVAIHVAGVVVESLAHRENLVAAMFTGRKAGTPEEAIASSHRLVAVLMLACAALGAAWFLEARLAGGPAAVRLPFVGKQLPDNKAWREECGSCHVAYHPTLLPARSWKRILERQDAHFGEALGLDKAAVEEIAAFLQKNSAETEMTEPAYKINKSIAADNTPTRITETGYWIEKHREIDSKTWLHPKVGSKANCSACHLDAEAGTYEDAAMRLPR